MGRMTSLEKDYFRWLFAQVTGKRARYMLLCQELHKKSFRWFIPNDDNRRDDGLNLRDIFLEEKRYDESHLEIEYFLKADCTVFEVLVALAQRMNDLMYDLADTRNDKTPKFFEEMLGNLGLAHLTDASFLGEGVDPVTDVQINETLEVLMDRTYAYDGRGGLFPLKKRPPEDQSRVEIWYQMMLYLTENYG